MDPSTNIDGAVDGDQRQATARTGSLDPLELFLDRRLLHAIAVSAAAATAVYATAAAVHSSDPARRRRYAGLAVITAVEAAAMVAVRRRRMRPASS